MIWDGIASCSDALSDDAVKMRHRLADSAKAYKWRAVLKILDDDPTLVNTTRPGGRSLYTPLHQAAYGAAPVDVVRELLARGAWRTIQNSRGERATDVAVARGHSDLASLLEPVFQRAVPIGVLLKMQEHFHAVIHGRVSDLVGAQQLRLPELEPLLEVEGEDVYFPVPGMYGGFNYRLVKEGVGATLVVESWCRVAGGSGQRHEITSAGSRMVDEGFV